MTAAAPGVPGDKILRAVGRYRLLTRPQLTRLLYGRSSTTFVGEHLTRLTRAGYLRMDRVPLQIPFGGTPGVWSLRGAGARYLRQAGLDVPTPTDRPLTSPLHLQHLLTLNDALVALERLCRDHPHLELERMRHDLELRRLRIHVRLADGRAGVVVPDAWVDLLVADAPMGLALELDRATEDEAKWARKLDGLLALAAGPYREQLGADSMTVAVITTGGQRRLAALRRWTEQALDRHGLSDWGELFCFTAADPAVVAPEALYLASSWIRPYAAAPCPLIPLAAS